MSDREQKSTIGLFGRILSDTQSTKRRKDAKRDLKMRRQYRSLGHPVPKSTFDWRADRIAADTKEVVGRIPGIGSSLGG